MKSDNLPNDIHEEIKKNKILLKEKDLQIQKRDKLIINLEDALNLLRRKRFAPSSEASHSQVSIFKERFNKDGIELKCIGEEIFSFLRLR